MTAYRTSSKVPNTISISPHQRTTIYPSYNTKDDYPYPFYRPNMSIQTISPPISPKPTNPTHPSRILPSSILCTQNCAIGTLARSLARTAAKKKTRQRECRNPSAVPVSHPQLSAVSPPFLLGTKEESNKNHDIACQVFNGLLGTIDLCAC